jgi:hypothetical protein
MLKQIADRKITGLEAQLSQANLLIEELVGALTMPDSEVRYLIRDVAVEYLATIKEDDEWDGTGEGDW